MKLARDAKGLALELERQLKTKKDFLSPATAVTVEVPSKKSKSVLPVEFHLKGVPQTFGINDIGHEHLSAKVKIPKDYYMRMLGLAPELLTRNINTWMGMDNRKFLLRTLDGDLRGVLSDSFRRLDNYDAANVIFPTILEKGAEIKSCEVTDRRMYIQAVTPKIQGEVRKGDVVQAGVCISNSELGFGSVKVDPIVLRLVCLNGMIVGSSLRKYHVGRKNEFEGDVAKFFSAKTNEMDDRLFWRKVKEVVDGSFNEALFAETLNTLKEAAGEQIKPKEVEAVIELTAETFTLSEGEKSNLLSNMLESGDLTKWGLANAVTALSHEAENYDRSVELERFGGDVIRLPNLSNLINNN